jgi:hypothetical protein
MLDTTPTNTITAEETELLQRYQELADALAQKHHAFARAAETDRETDGVEHVVTERLGNLVAERHVKHLRQQTAAARQRADADWAACVAQARNADAVREASLRAEEERRTRAAKLEDARKAWPKP